MYEFSIKFLDFLLSKTGGMTLVIGAFCAVGILAYCGEKLWQSIANNEPVNLYQFVRPFLMAFLCLNFSWIIGVTNELLEPINKGVYNHVIKNRGNGQAFDEQQAKALQQKANEMRVNLNFQELDKLLSSSKYDKSGAYREARQGLQGEELNDFILEASLSSMRYYDMTFQWGKYWKLRSHTRSIMRGGKESWSVSRIVREVIVLLANLFYHLVKFGIQCLRVVYLSLLILMGPIAIAFSIFPGFTGNFKHWLIKYISIYLWLPILYFIDFTIYLLNNYCASPNFVPTGQINMMVATLEIIAVFCMLSIPTIASWMIQGGETGQGMRNPFAMIGAGIGGLAGAAVGGSVAGRAARANAESGGGATPTPEPSESSSGSEESITS